MPRLARRFLSVCAIAVLCVSCRVDVDVNLTVQPDGSGIVTITAAADAAVVDQAPGLAADLRFDDVRAAGWTVTGPTAEANGGLRVVLTQAFATPAQANQILAGVSGPNGPLVGITLARKRAGGTTTFRLNGTLQVTGGLGAFTDENLLAAVGATPFADELAASQVAPADAVGITFDAVLPGTVKSTTGAETPGRLTWKVPADGAPGAVDTVAEIRAPTRAWADLLTKGALVALGVWLVLSACFIAYVVLARRRRATRR
ncbi:unannotated protein [freshwater metagenome]|uniref:Unannotated protein n=1 Tax=freshwater metagenome TaxID=449393 RepID=A0A6J7EUF5_9ZZZZ|nr:hypothetical protein [Actinomycetota bacterium]